MAKQSRDYTYDHAMLMKDAGLVAADAAATVAAAARILDLGLARFDGVLVVTITAVEIASNDERYDIGIQLSNSASFASVIAQGPILAVGALETLIGADQDTAVGTYELPFCNEINGVLFRYARVYTNVTGTIATGINFSAFVATVSV